MQGCPRDLSDRRLARRPTGAPRKVELAGACIASGRGGACCESWWVHDGVDGYGGKDTRQRTVPICTISCEKALARYVIELRVPRAMTQPSTRAAWADPARPARCAGRCTSARSPARPATRRRPAWFGAVAPWACRWAPDRRACPWQVARRRQARQPPRWLHRRRMPSRAAAAPRPSDCASPRSAPICRGWAAGGGPQARVGGQPPWLEPWAPRLPLGARGRPCEVQVTPGVVSICPGRPGNEKRAAFHLC